MDLSAGQALAEEEQNAFNQKWHSMKLDNFNDSEKRTFQSRYWENDDAWDKQNGPIFLYICGEWTCDPPSVSSPAFSLGQKLNGKLMALEHRYYGFSQPFNDSQGGWSYENLKWLTSPQALADIAQFIDSKNSEFEGKHQWVVIGCSYAGAVVAWFKSQYPDHASAAWSSSGVIDTIQFYEDYDLDIYQTT